MYANRWLAHTRFSILYRLCICLTVDEDTDTRTRMAHARTRVHERKKRDSRVSPDAPRPESVASSSLQTGRFLGKAQHTAALHC